MSKTIMYLEDDENARELFEDYFKRKKYDVRVFETAAEAEKALIDFKPNIIISDQKLGGNCLGWDFLKKSIALSPFSMRFILSGYSEEQMIINSFKDGLIFDYILKSEAFDVIEKKMEDAFAFLDVLKKKNLIDLKLVNDPEEQIYHIVLQQLKFYTKHLAYKEQEIQRLTDLIEENKK